MDEDTIFERECAVVGMYIDSAKSYTQLSTGALALVAVFGPAKLPDLNNGLLVACGFLLVAALSGGAYQSLAVGELENLSKLNDEDEEEVEEKDEEEPKQSVLRSWLRSWQHNAYLFYNALVVTFHLGAIMLAFVAIQQLWPQSLGK